jgi:hypothetical protein
MRRSILNSALRHRFNTVGTGEACYRRKVRSGSAASNLSPARVLARMETVHMYVLLGAPPRSEAAAVLHQELTADDFDRLRTEYEAAALDDAVIVARRWLNRMLDAQAQGGPIQASGDHPGPDEGTALHVLFGCLALKAHDPIRAGNRWAMIDVRYYPEEARVNVMWWATEPHFIVAPRQIGHA